MIHLVWRVLPEFARRYLIRRAMTRLADAFGRTAREAAKLTRVIDDYAAALERAK